MKRVCTNQSRRSCDLSEADLYYFGMYRVRVRAEANGSHSEWAELTFGPDQHGERTVCGVKGQGGRAQGLICLLLQLGWALPAVWICLTC